MAQLNINPDGYLADLGSFLEKGPENGYLGLDELPNSLNEFLERGQLDLCQKVVQILGDAVGKQSDWQIPFKEAGILVYILEKLDCHYVNVELTRQYLRVIGNCVADNVTDELRETVTHYFLKISSCMDKDELRTTALVVLLNLCNEYDAAQQRAAELRLDGLITDYLSEDMVAEEAVDYAVDLLSWTTEKLGSDQIADYTSIVIFGKLLDISLRDDGDHFEYIAICAHYLQDPQFQLEVASPETLAKIFDLIINIEKGLDTEGTEAVLIALSSKTDPDEIPSEDTNSVLLVQLITCLSAISASDAFARHIDIQSPFIQKVIANFGSDGRISGIQVLECIILANVATSDNGCVKLVEEEGIHAKLLDILSREDTPLSLLYAAAGFMRHLVVPQANKILLGQTKFLDICCHILSNEDPSIKGEAAALMRVFVTDNLHNIRKLLYERIPVDVEPSLPQESKAGGVSTVLEYLITVALTPTAPVPSTSMKIASIEVGRLFVAVLRFLCRPSAGEDTEELLKGFCQTLLFARPIARLVQQRFFADARSEGLLGLGLMAQSREGAAGLVKELGDQSGRGVLEAIREFSTSQKNERGNRDPQNALVLLHGLLKNGVSFGRCQVGTVC
ncbi:hypothetical protein GQ43DRAFT_375267 [Delitschia confertaspora ATCC 74209]|uniref:ARM repeat-containing protein n=1 Tax=Delitschia confertaspora ATCC 74209 TaxID=1513339 RepID=A0A9P4JI42_9PLEO|nr:hypothetical protein GQ43DRAFT_375267 [Delitschia confertaspora ATCC 74209]